jgi:hypothetical protein
MKRFFPLLFLFIFSGKGFTQDIVFKDVLKENREKLFRNLVNKTIYRNLSNLPTDSTEEDWQNAFGAMELLNYKSPWIDNKVSKAMDSIQYRTIPFQRAMLECIYTNYPEKFSSQVKGLLEQTTDAKIFAMCSAYLLENNKNEEQKNYVSEKAATWYLNNPENPLIHELIRQLHTTEDKQSPDFSEFLSPSYLPGNTLLISFQRKNRNYPGLVLVRDGKGNFIKDDYGNYFSVPQLARSITNLPCYLTNGNTPQGIFRMDGFDQSKSTFIGPTNNIQLSMPFEKPASHFYKDPGLPDSSWNINRYKKMLPENFKDYAPMWQSYYAGKAGRTEIIAHGTTINPRYYLGKTYYPLTPTQGCLCTKEIWDEETGKLLESDQQKLTNAISKAGGPYGYAIVIEIDDKQEPVSIDEIIPFLKLAAQK